MNIKVLNIVFFSLLVFSATFASSKTQIENETFFVTYSTQDTSITEINFTSSKEAKMKTGAFGEVVNGTQKSGEVVPDYIRRPKDLPADFTGYKVELMTVYNKKLSLNDELYKQFGGITIEQRTANSYTYLVGTFNDKEACNEYIEKVIQPRYPDAKGVKYQQGIIVNYK